MEVGGLWTAGRLAVAGLSRWLILEGPGSRGVEVEKQTAGSAIRKGWAVEGGWRGGGELVGRASLKVTLRMEEVEGRCTWESR